MGVKSVIVHVLQSMPPSALHNVANKAKSLQEVHRTNIPDVKCVIVSVNHMMQLNVKPFVNIEDSFLQDQKLEMMVVNHVIASNVLLTMKTPATQSVKQDA